jgi:hypothetical protein
MVAAYIDRAAQEIQMASKSSSTQRAHKPERAQAAAQPNPLLQHTGIAGTGQQMAMLSEIMAQAFRTTANLQMAQQDLAQQAARLFDEAGEHLRSAQDFSEIAHIQSKLMASCARAAMECCQDLMLAGARLGSAGAEPAPAPQPEPSSAQAAADAAINAMAPAMQAWQQFLAMAAHSNQTPHH